jgi:hypothetical protein
MTGRADIDVAAPGATGRNARARRHGAAIALRPAVRLWLPLLVIFHVTVVAAASGRADGLYFTEQLGVSRVGGELGNYFRGGFSGHIGGGYHLDGWALEGHMRFDELEGRGALAADTYDLLAWGVGVRRLFPVSPWVRLYARGGVEAVEIEQYSSGESLVLDGYKGSGIDLGGGLVLSGRVPLVGFLFAPLFFTDIGPKVSAAAWLDVGDRLIALDKPGASDLHGFSRSWLLGFSLGGSF